MNARACVGYTATVVSPQASVGCNLLGSYARALLQDRGHVEPERVDQTELPVY